MSSSRPTFPRPEIVSKSRLFARVLYSKLSLSQVNSGYREVSSAEKEDMLELEYSRTLCDDPEGAE